MPLRIELTGGAQGRSPLQPGSPGATLLLGPLGHAGTSVPGGSVAAVSCCTDIGSPASIACRCQCRRHCPACRRSLPQLAAGNLWVALRRHQSPPRRQLAPVRRRLCALQALHGAGRSGAWRVLAARGRVGSVPTQIRCGHGKHRSAAFVWRFSSHISELGRI